ncbi:hypothetical protein Q7P35_004081 [Cladosporium inversicolor]
MAPPQPSRNTPQTLRPGTASATIRKDGLEERDIMAANALVALANAGTMDSERASTVADLKRHNIALRLRNGDLNISEDAIQLLKRSVEAFVLDLLEKNKPGEPHNPIKAQQQILAAKREADRKGREKRDDGRLAALLKRMTDAIECQKQPDESEEERLMRETVKRVDVATQKDKFRKTADRRQAFRQLEATAALYEDLYDPTFDFGLGIRLSVFGPLEEVEAEQLDGLAKTQQWVALEDAGVDYRRRKKLAGEGRLTVDTALRMGASVLEFTFEPTADVRKPAQAGRDKSTIPDGPGNVAAASHTVNNNNKLKGASADVQRTTAKKLDKSTTLTTPTSTTDEALASALSSITIFKAEKASTAAPNPQPQPPSNNKPSPRNPFYRPDMTLTIAAQNIHAYFLEATDWLTFWHISFSALMLIDLSQKPTSTLSRIFCHLGWTAEFLRFGRAGWDLRRLPGDFFEDVLPLIMISCWKLEKLAEWKGCGGMMIGAWKDAEEVGETLATVRNVMVRDGKGT